MVGAEENLKRAAKKVDANMEFKRAWNTIETQILLYLDVFENLIWVLAGLSFEGNQLNDQKEKYILINEEWCK